MTRNKLGQFTGQKVVSVKLAKRLQTIAKEDGIKLKAMVRDELERTLILEIQASYRPATKRGKEVQAYNETHKHQKPRPYHHIGLLASKIYATIEGDIIQAKVKDVKYPDGASTTKVYDYLKFGTPDEPKNGKKGFFYNNGQNFSPYISQEPHNFEARTREHMRQFIGELENSIYQYGAKKINPKYLKKLK